MSSLGVKKCVRKVALYFQVYNEKELRVKKVIAGILLVWSAAFADKITIFAAADLRFALEAVKEAFLEQHPGHELAMIYGSSGKGVHQVENGAPYDLYFSANEAFVEKLYAQGDIVTPPKLYALGRIVIWSKHPRFDPKLGFENFNQPWVRKIAIAHPGHAPYGEKAKQAMESLGMFEALSPKLVTGENISHAAQFIESGAADLGIIALSLALAPTISQGSHPQHYLIDERLHAPLLQAYGITKYGKNSKLAHDFYGFMETQRALEVMASFGFLVPGEAP